MSNELGKEVSINNGVATELTVRHTGAVLELGLANPMIFTTLDRSTDEGKDRYIAAMGTADLRIQDLVNKTFQVTDLVAHHAELSDQTTGEVINKVRLVMFLADGKTLSCCSEGIYRSLKVITGEYGLPSKASPFSLEIIPITTRNGRQTYNLRKVATPATTPVKGGK